MCKINKECCSLNARLMMIGIPIILICAGIIVIIEGAKMIADSGSELVLLHHYKVPSQLSTLVNMTYLLVAVGPVMLVMGFLGAFVCLKDSKLILLLYCLSLLISFIVEVSGATAVLVYKNSADQYLNSMHGEVKKSIQEEYGDNEEVTSMWNSTMDEMKCCGFKNYRDFDGSPFDIAHGGDVYPSRCCSLFYVGVCTERKANNSDVDGCSDRLQRVVHSNTDFTAGVILSIAIFELFAMVVLIILRCENDDDGDEFESEE